MINSKTAFVLSFGCMLESYDFFAYSFLLPVLKINLFGAGNEFSYSTVLLIIFAVGAVARPIGSVIFGHLGDKYGRQGAVANSMLYSGLVTAIIAVIPTYQQLGIFAVIMYSFVRFTQGLCFGGNIAGLFTYMYEGCNIGNRSFWVGSIVFSMLRGLLVSFFVTEALRLSLSPVLLDYIYVIILLRLLILRDYLRKIN
jgi:MFS family permease